MRSRADVEAGLFFMIFGAGTASMSARYSLGSATEMGPGYFPLLLGGLLLLIGIAVAAKGFAKGEAETLAPINYRAVAAVTASVILFGALLLSAGLLIAIPATVLVSLLAARGWSWRSAIVTAVVLTGMSYLVFIVGLDLRIPVLGGF